METLKSKAYKIFNGKKYTLYKSGTKEQVNDYKEKHGIPKNARYRIVNSGSEYRLYMLFSK